MICICRGEGWFQVISNKRYTCTTTDTYCTTYRHLGRLLPSRFPTIIRTFTFTSWRWSWNTIWRRSCGYNGRWRWSRWGWSWRWRCFLRCRGCSWWPNLLCRGCSWWFGGWFWWKCRWRFGWCVRFVSCCRNLRLTWTSWRHIRRRLAYTYEIRAPALGCNWGVATL